MLHLRTMRGVGAHDAHAPVERRAVTHRQAPGRNARRTDDPRKYSASEMRGPCRHPSGNPVAIWLTGLSEPPRALIARLLDASPPRLGIEQRLCASVLREFAHAKGLSVAELIALLPPIRVWTEHAIRALIDQAAGDAASDESR